MLLGREAWFETPRCAPLLTMRTKEKCALRNFPGGATPRRGKGTMAKPIQIRMGGYGPPTTGFSRALKLVGEELAARFGDRIDVKYVWNVMDLGYRAEDILWLVESGVLTLGYQSSSYLTDRVPELGFVDLPFLFAGTAPARAAMDGRLGKFLAEKIEQRVDYRILGWFENGFRQISNRLRPVRSPADLSGMRMRVLPSDVQARTFALLGAVPLRLDLTEAIAAIKVQEIDAQENPFANTVTYGVHKFHRFHTVSNHFYISRPIFLHRPAFDGWPADLQDAMRAAVARAVAAQRGFAVAEDREARAAIVAQGCEIVELTADEHAAFAAAVAPLLADARGVYGRELFDMASAA
jgi:TRAP-type C4-dicarboxylate transport system substrate-binding protein